MRFIDTNRRAAATSVQAFATTFLLSIASSRNCYAEDKSSIPAPIQSAVQAADLCYHWAEETGDQTPERNRDISNGVARDCPDAKKKAIDAHNRYPSNPYLSLALLKLNDIGYFDLSDEQKKAICEQGASLMKSGYFKSNHQDSYFKVLCPQSSSK